MNCFSLAVIFVTFSLSISQPPFSGTIFNFPESFTDDDPTTLVEVNYVGREEKTVFDRRTNRTTINAYIFSAVFNDDSPDWEITVNPEFSLEEATELAEKYSFNIGQMPHCIRAGVSGAVIHDGGNLWGGGDPLTIHHGQGLNYERQGIITETMIHESTHAEFDRQYYNSDWSEAADADGEFISTYARDNPNREDHSETFLCWLVANYKRDRISDSDYDKITSTIPNRMEFYNNQDLNLSPVGGTNVPILVGLSPSRFNVGYDPINSTITVGANLEEPARVFLQILDLKGRVITNLDDKWAGTGNQQMAWKLNSSRGQHLSGGQYVYRMTAGDYEESKSLVVLPR